MEYAPYKHQSVKRFALDYLKKDGLDLEFVTDKLKNDSCVVKTAIAENGDALIFAAERFLNDKNMVLEAIKTSHHPSIVYQKLSDSMKNDREVIIKCVLASGEMIPYLSEKHQKDPEILDLLITRYGNYLIYQGADFIRNDDKIVRKCIKSCGLSLRYASTKFKSDPEIVLDVIKKFPSSIQYASYGLLEDKEFILQCIQVNHSIFRYLPLELRNCKDIVKDTILLEPLMLEFASDELKQDEDIVLQAAILNEHSLYFASENLRKDIYFVKEVLSAVNGECKGIPNSIKQRALALKVKSARKIVFQK